MMNCCWFVSFSSRRSLSSFKFLISASRSRLATPRDGLDLADQFEAERINRVQGLLVFFAGESGRTPSLGPLALSSGARISFRHGAILTPVRVHYRAHTWPYWAGSEALVAGLCLYALSAISNQCASLRDELSLDERSELFFMDDKY